MQQPRILDLGLDKAFLTRDDTLVTIPKFNLYLPGNFYIF